MFYNDYSYGCCPPCRNKGSAVPFPLSALKLSVVYSRHSRASLLGHDVRKIQDGATLPRFELTPPPSEGFEVIHGTIRATGSMWKNWKTKDISPIQSQVEFHPQHRSWWIVLSREDSLHCTVRTSCFERFAAHFSHLSLTYCADASPEYLLLKTRRGTRIKSWIFGLYMKIVTSCTIVGRKSNCESRKDGESAPESSRKVQQVFPGWHNRIRHVVSGAKKRCLLAKAGISQSRFIMLTRSRGSFNSLGSWRNLRFDIRSNRGISNHR